MAKRVGISENMLRVVLMRHKLRQVGDEEAVENLVRQAGLDEAQARALIRTSDTIPIDRKLLRKHGYGN